MWSAIVADSTPNHYSRIRPTWRSTIQSGCNLSSGRLLILILPSLLHKQNRDSLLKTIRLHSWVQFRLSMHHWSRWVLCLSVRGGPVMGLLDPIPDSSKRLFIVLVEVIGWISTPIEAWISETVALLLFKAILLIRRSILSDVIRGAPGEKFLVCLPSLIHKFQHLSTVEWSRPTKAATSLEEKPASDKPPFPLSQMQLNSYIAF